MMNAYSLFAQRLYKGEHIMNDTFTHSSDLMYLFFAPMFISLALFNEMKKYSLYLSALMGLIFLLCLLGFIFSLFSVWRFDADDDIVI